MDGPQLDAQVPVPVSTPVPAEAAPAIADMAAGDAEPRPGVRGPLGRRTFVVRALALAGGAIAAMLAIPVAGFAAAPGLRSQRPVRLLSTSVVPTLRSDEWTSVGTLADFTPGVPKYVQVERNVIDGWVSGPAMIGVHVVRLGDTAFQAFDPHCTHLGCPLAWSDGASSFVCPCHGGAFSASGDVVSGPPPRSLFQYETKVQDGKAMIGRLVEDA